MTLTHLAAWSDDRGNVIEYDGPPRQDVAVRFRGSNNRLVVHANADDHTSQPIGGAGARIACGVIAGG